MATKKPLKNINILRCLSTREIRGTLQLLHKKTSASIFPLIPSRLCYKLCNLVSMDVLEEGHVFLGFTKCGGYVISYSCQMTQGDLIGMPRYVYALQWWKFSPSSPLIKVREVNLFGDEVDHSLYISFCEWPEDQSQVLVFGYSLPSRNQDTSCQCYITVTSFYSTQSCQKCSYQRIEEKKSKSLKKSCLRHDYSIHTKYELTPPFPPFKPHVQLLINGVAIINTGDSLIALQVSVGNPEFLENSQVLGMADPDSSMVDLKGDPSGQLSQGSETSGKIQGSVCSACGQDLELRPFKGQDEGLKENLQHGSIKDNLRQQKMQKSGTDLQGRSPKSFHVDCHSKSPKSYGEKAIEACSPKPYDKFEFIESPPVRNECDGSDMFMDKENGAGKKPVPSPSSDFGSVMSPLSDCDFKNVMSPTKSDNIQVHPTDKLCKSEGSGFNSKTSPVNKIEGRCEVFCSLCGAKIFHSSQPHSRKAFANTDSPQTTPRPGNLSSTPGSPPSRHANPVYSPYSPPGAWLQSRSPSCSYTTSQSADSTYQQMNESCTVSFNVRNFSQGPLSGDTSSQEDDLDYAYRTVLPIDIVAGNNMPLYLTPPIDENQDYVKVSQITFDVEHFLEEIIRRRASWGHRYVAFTNYDLQILSVCPDSRILVGKVFVLIHAKEASDNPKRKRSRSSVKLYQTCITFTWNLSNGVFNTEIIEPLTEVEELNLRMQDWRPGLAESSVIRRQLFIPHSTKKYVNILTNEAVFKGKSLSMIISSQMRVAIFLGR